MIAPPARPDSLVRQDRFTTDESTADVAVVIVTYRNADSISTLVDSLRSEAAVSSIRVVVVDNNSGDGTASTLAAHDDVIVVAGEVNLGYAGAINVARSRIGATRAVLILNPDCVVQPGCVTALRAALREPGVVAAVPRLHDVDGRLSFSLRREPRLPATLVDAMLGARLPRRPVWASETIRDVAVYDRAHSIEWATGAAMMMSAGALDAVGPWDERFFLYSEETDYFRRLRSHGLVLYVPEARVEHTGGGSGSSQALADLLTVNKIRYVQKYHARPFVVAFHAVTLLGEAVRCWSSGHRATYRAVARRHEWSNLLRAETPGPTECRDMGSVVIPAHNESRVIARTLDALADLAARGVVEVIVACNGCTDDTARIAAGRPGVRVLDLGVASKTAAMNSADEVAELWPRVYLDADVVITPAAVVDLVTALADGTLLAARPASRYDATGAGHLVRRYYRARSSLPLVRSHLWGAGCYALSEEGHARVGRFPDVVADDVVVDAAFATDEKTVVDTDPVVVLVPRTPAALIAVLSRNYSGNRDAPATTSSTGTLRHVAGTVHGPGTLLDAAVYCLFAALGRRASRRTSARWARDDTSRS